MHSCVGVKDEASPGDQEKQEDAPIVGCGSELNSSSDQMSPCCGICFESEPNLQTFPCCIGKTVCLGCLARLDGEYDVAVYGWERAAGRNERDSAFNALCPFCRERISVNFRTKKRESAICNRSDLPQAVEISCAAVLPIVAFYFEYLKAEELLHDFQFFFVPTTVFIVAVSEVIAVGTAFPLARSACRSMRCRRDRASGADMIQVGHQAVPRPGGGSGRRQNMGCVRCVNFFYAMWLLLQLCSGEEYVVLSTLTGLLASLLFVMVCVVSALILAATCEFVRSYLVRRLCSQSRLEVSPAAADPSLRTPGAGDVHPLASVVNES